MKKEGAVSVSFKYIGLSPKIFGSKKNELPSKIFIGSSLNYISCLLPMVKEGDV